MSFIEKNPGKIAGKLRVDSGLKVGRTIGLIIISIVMITCSLVRYLGLIPF